MKQDELRDLESLSEPLPDHHGKGGDLVGLGGAAGAAGSLSGSRAQQLLSRGGPVVKSEPTMAPAPSRLGTTRSGTAAAAAAGGLSGGLGGATTAAGGNATNHYASGAAYNGRHTGPYVTTTTAGGRSNEGARAQGGVYGDEGMGGGQGSGAGPTGTHHAVRGRPVVSGMGIMVGGGPRTGAAMGVGGDGEERKFVGAYSPEARRQRIQRFLQKREHRVSIVVFLGSLCLSLIYCSRCFLL